MQNIGIISHDYRYDWHLSLNGKVEGALFERKHVRLRAVGPCAFRENENTLSLRFHCTRSTVEGESGGLAITAVNEDRLAEGHCAQGVKSDHEHGRASTRKYSLNQPRKGTHLSDFLAVTLQ